MKLFVTGAVGMLGSAVTALAIERGDEVIASTIAELDITDAAAVRRTVEAVRPRVVINCAAHTQVDQCEADAGFAERVNGHAPGYLAEALKPLGGLLVHISTDYVFAGRATTPYTEDAPTSPLSAYGRSKLNGEEAVRRVGGRWLIVRGCALYGAGGKNFIDTMAEKALAGQSVSVVTDQTTTPTHVQDLARALFALLDRGREGLYHVSALGHGTWHRCAQVVYEALGADPARVEATTSARLHRPAPRPAYSVFDTGKFRRDTGMALPRWDVGVRDYLIATRGAAAA